MQLLDRELSWLDFNARILAMAEAEHVRLLERVKFCAIFATNLDEFFMVRVAGLGPPTRDEVLGRSDALARRHARLWRDALAPSLADAGIRIGRWPDLADAERAGLTGHFVERVFPALTPLAIDPAQPFPHIANRSLNVLVALREPLDGSEHLALVEVPPTMPRFLVTDADLATTLVPLEQVVAGNLDRLFPGMDIAGRHAFRVTRHTDGTDSTPVRLEVGDAMPQPAVDLLARGMGLERGAVHRLPEPLGLGDAWELHRLDRPDLKDPEFTPRDIGAADVMARLPAAEMLVHHPYDSFATSVQAFIEQAADDPQVLAIKQTLYRTTADPIVNALVRAAASGKQVVVVVELQARFDEENNRAWGRMLERAGCHVVYGISDLKTHAKLALVVRREGSTTRRYVHIGTGNYNATTTRTYEDFGLLSADPGLTREVGELFNLLTGHAHQAAAERLMVAPFDLRPRLLARIGAETDAARAGSPAAIAIKCNALTDPEVISALYDASRAGVAIALVVRGICSLRPGVPGLSSTIRVRSILGRFLEHSRIFRFGSGPSAERWIGSADLMERNLDRRVEVLVRLDDPAHAARIDRVLELAMSDTASAWTLGADGRWTPPPDAAGGRALQAELLTDTSHAEHATVARMINAVGGCIGPSH